MVVRFGISRSRFWPINKRSASDIFLVRREPKCSEPSGDVILDGGGNFNQFDAFKAKADDWWLHDIAASEVLYLLLPLRRGAS